ncbi:cadherin-like beta sandwich domain-containing protein [Paenibacillus sp. J22TS3]|uniref:cadherin-like beta sandwich domain-containing protein n=1 Tax=Paenibacillus sp. J22TS3 TaxID=2807192 RepID=UPI001B2C414C|nr:cadherin-like beta sandwich domain-containing protein [Paenibacillus sp. J22TS3]GIP23125.1 hypothetical protein J22TS3_34000 [Paenibacillus sp. J22TS3]
MKNVSHKYLLSRIMTMIGLAVFVLLPVITAAGSKASAAGNADLSEVFRGEIYTTAFDPGITSYTAYLGSSTDNYYSAFKTADPSATMQYSLNGGGWVNLLSWTSTGNLGIQYGHNTFDLKVTSSDSATTKTYRFNLNRAFPNDSSLRGLVVSSGTLNPGFAPGTMEYTMDVSYTTNSLSLTPILGDSSAAVTVNHASTASGAPYGPIALEVGSNTIQVNVTSADASKSSLYQIVVNRAKSSNADLSGLTLDQGAVLSPEFASGKTSYTANVANVVHSINVSPSLADSNATVTVNGSVVTSGAPTAVNLNVGANEIKLVVTAQDGSTKTYTLTVTRAASSNAALDNISIDQGSLTPAFTPTNLNYSVALPNTASNLNLLLTKSDLNETLSVSGAVYHSESGSVVTYNASLRAGENPIRIVVTAQDGSLNTYNINVTRESLASNADLSGLSLSEGELSPAFSSSKSSYTSYVPYRVSSLSVTASVYEPHASVKVNGEKVDSGQASRALHLDVGMNLIQVIVTAQDATTKTYSIAVTRASDSSGSSSSGSPTVSTVNEVPPVASASWELTINGTQQKDAAKVTTTNLNNQTVLTAELDKSKLDSIVGHKGTIVLRITSTVDRVDSVLSGEAVKLLENKQAALEIQTPNGNYMLSASELLIDSLSKQWGGQTELKDITVHVSISKSNTNMVRLMEETAGKESFTVVAPPVDFAVTASYNNQTVNVDKFSSYVEREIPIPNGVGTSKITTAIVLNENGTTRHIPTYVTSHDGRSYAVVKSLTNSTYALIWHPAAFTDVEGHWAQSAVNDMGSRMIVTGEDSSHYRPDATITRAEFTAIVVRALGLPDNGSISPFGDVKSGDWFVGAVAQAKGYGMINGYEDGTFRPLQTISRQEAMVMIERAMKIMGMTTKVDGPEGDTLLQPFSDRAAVDGWAKAAVAAVIKNGIVDGASAALLPKKEITRAETAAIVQRMLEKANFIN